jgi:threonine dehydrogenase-like Zn-dependent dehydrogenase
LGAGEITEDGPSLHWHRRLGLAGATTIIGVDTNPAQLEVATRFGATVVIGASTEDPAKAIRPPGATVASSSRSW